MRRWINHDHADIVQVDQFSSVIIFDVTVEHFSIDWKES